MKSKQKKLILTIIFLLVLALPIMTFARLPLPNVNTDTDPNNDIPIWGTDTDVGTLVIKIINILLSFAGVLAVLFIIVGGFQYIFSGANEEWAENGKKTLRNAIIGLVVIILSYVIVNVINNILTRP